MTEASEMLKLAERVEALEGPDREVDYLIADAALGPVKPPFRRGHCEKYTASIDAAMTLVPEGYGFQIDGYDKHWWSSLSEDEGFNAKAKAPALALCAAALRARHHLETTNDRHP